MLTKSDCNKIKDVFYTFLNAQNFKLANMLLQNTKVESLTQDEMIIYLEATHSEKNKLVDRHKFVEACKKVLLARNEKIKSRFEHSS